MQPQPAIPTTAPPLPPPPPPLSLSAFTQAASAASRYAPTFRKPTLQLAVLQGSPHRLFPHAYSILRSLAAKGVHGFLHAEFEHPATGVCTAITPELLPDVVAVSRADFLVLVADHNVQTRTVQLRLPPKPDFIDVPLAKICDIVLDTWTQRLRTVNNIAHLQALASNPNVVTTAHLDSLLHSISNLFALRRSYAKLARLANVTQDWQSVRLPKPVSVSRQPQHPPHSQPTTQQLQTLSTPLRSNTPFVPSSVASKWNYSDHDQSSSSPSGALPATTNTALANADQLTPHKNDFAAPASSQPGATPEAHSLTLISTQSPAMAHSKQDVLQPFETQQRQQRSTTSSNTTESTKQTLDSAPQSATDSNEAHTPVLSMRSEESSHLSADPPTSLGVHSSTDNVDVSTHDPDHSVAHVHPMTATALRRSLASIARANAPNQYSDKIRSSKPEFSFSWLKRSQHLSAKILRHQYLASHLHRTLLEACDSISKMQTSSRPTAYHEPNRLPTEAHRQRLLREIHDLVPRIEELGKRLSKRPKDKRRCRIFRETNPWDAYMTQAQSATITRGILGSNEQTKELSSAGWWRCWACRAVNDPDKSACSICCTRSCGIASNLASTYVDRLSDGLREAIKSTRVGPLPWIFTPSVLPIPPSVATQFTPGWLPKDRVDNDMISNPFPTEDGRGSLPGRFEPYSKGAHELSEHALRSQDPYDLSVAFNKLHCDDGYQRRDIERTRLGVPAFGRGSDLCSMSKSRRSDKMTSFPKRSSPMHIPSSAPNGPPAGELIPRIPKNGMHADTRDGITSGNNSTGPMIHHDLGLDGRTFGKLKQNTATTGSLPSLDPHRSNGLHGPTQSGSSSTHESYQTVDNFSKNTGFTERSYPSRFKPRLPKPMEELALGSYEAKSGMEMFPDEKRSCNPAKGPVAEDAYQSGGIASLKALAAASDAANGGTGSATKESLRTVSAAITAADDESQKPMVVPSVPNGTYNMF